MFLKLFAPCEALMRRLKLGQKFALIAVVLVAPLAFVTYSYVSSQGKQEAFSTKERRRPDRRPAAGRAAGRGC